MCIFFNYKINGIIVTMTFKKIIVWMRQTLILEMNWIWREKSESCVDLPYFNENPIVEIQRTISPYLIKHNNSELKSQIKKEQKIKWIS